MIGIFFKGGSSARKRLRWRAVYFVERKDYLKWVAGVALCAIPTLDTHRNDAHSLCGTPALPPRKNFSLSITFFVVKVNGEHPLRIYLIPRQNQWRTGVTPALQPLHPL